MSLKLLKQSVDIIEEDLNQNTRGEKRKQTTNKKLKNRKILNNNGMKKYEKSNEKISIQSIRQEMKSSSTKSEENIKRLLVLSMNTVKVKDAEMIARRAHRGRYVEKIIPEVEQTSIFTEEDFRKFEEEYLNT